MRETSKRIKTYLKDKCEKNPEFIKNVNNALFTGIHNIYENERKERIEVETLTVSAMDLSISRKGSKTYDRSKKLLNSKLSFLKYFSNEDFKEKFK